MNKFKIIIPLLMLIVGVYMVPIRFFDHDFSKIPGDLADARFNNYILEHGHQFLTGNVDSYWNAPFMFPYKENIVFSDNLLGSLPMYSVWRFVGLDRETSFQWWILTIFVLNFLAALWVLQRWSENYILASVGAYIFAFSITLVGNIHHVQTLPRFILPFLFYWLWRFLKEKETKYFVGLALGLVYQFYCGVYLGFLAFYVLAFFMISLIIISKDYWISKEQLFSKVFIRDVVITITVSGLFLGVLMLPYYVHSQAYGLRRFSDVVDSIPTLQSYFFTHKSSLLWGQVLGEHGKKIPSYWYHFLFVGVFPWLAIVGSVFLTFSKKRFKENKGMLSILLTALFLSIIFSVRIGEFSLYHLVYKLPGFSAMRSVNRIINTELFLFILVLIFFFKRLSIITKYGKYIIFALPVLVIFDNFIFPEKFKSFEKSESQSRVLKVKNAILKQKKVSSKAIAYLPINKGNVAYSNLDAMLASQDLNIPCVNSYSGSCPGAICSFLVHQNIGTLKHWLTNKGVDLDEISVINDQEFLIVSRKEVNISFKGKFVCRENKFTVSANREVAAAWEKFTLVEFENGDYALRAYENKFLSTQINKDGQLVSNRDEPLGWERFKIIDLGNRQSAFVAVNSKKWSVNPNTFQLKANSDLIGENETFRIHFLD